MVQIHYSDIELPKTSIQRITKEASDGKFVQKDAKLAFGKAATVFVSYLTAVATELAKSSGHKSLSKAHIEAALEAIGFGEWKDEISIRLQRYSADSKRKESGQDVEMVDFQPSEEAQPDIPEIDVTNNSDLEMDTQPLDDMPI